jgi:hypothetical protein
MPVDSSPPVRDERDNVVVETTAPKPSLLAVLAELEPWHEEFPDVDAGLLPLDQPKL